MREDPDTQRVEQPLHGAPRVARVGPCEEPVGRDGEEEECRRHEQHLLGALEHTVLQAALHEQGSGERDERVHDDEAEPDEQLLSIGTHEPAKPERLVGTRLGGNVDFGKIVGRRERSDRRRELRRDLRRARPSDHPGTGAGATPSATTLAQPQDGRDRHEGADAIAVSVRLVAPPEARSHAPRPRAPRPRRPPRLRRGRTATCGTAPMWPSAPRGCRPRRRDRSPSR